MIAYLIAISTWIFGDNSFGVRIFAVVCSFLSSIFVCKITKKFFDEKTGFLSGIIFNLCQFLLHLELYLQLTAPLYSSGLYQFIFFCSLLKTKKSGGYYLEL